MYNETVLEPKHKVVDNKYYKYYTIDNIELRQQYKPKRKLRTWFKMTLATIAYLISNTTMTYSSIRLNKAVELKATIEYCARWEGLLLLSIVIAILSIAYLITKSVEIFKQHK